MDIVCPKCEGQLLRRRPDGSTECVCVSCGTATVLPDPKSSQFADGPGDERSPVTF
jgi:hypothetical protein